MIFFVYIKPQLLDTKQCTEHDTGKCNCVNWECALGLTPSEIHQLNTRRPTVFSTYRVCVAKYMFTTAQTFDVCQSAPMRDEMFDTFKLNWKLSNIFEVEEKNFNLCTNKSFTETVHHHLFVRLKMSYTLKFSYSLEEEDEEENAIKYHEYVLQPSSGADYIPHDIQYHTWHHMRLPVYAKFEDDATKLVFYVQDQGSVENTAELSEGFTWDTPASNHSAVQSVIMKKKNPAEIVCTKMNTFQNAHLYWCSSFTSKDEILQIPDVLEFDAINTIFHEEKLD